GGLPEEGLEALKAEIGDGRDILGGLAGGGLDHGADADGFCGIAHVKIPQAAMGTRRPVRALSMAAKTMARLFMLSLPAVSGARPLSMAARKSAMTLAWPCVWSSSVGAGISISLRSRKKPVSPSTIRASKCSSPSQSRVPFVPVMRQAP